MNTFELIKASYVLQKGEAESQDQPVGRWLSHTLSNQIGDAVLGVAGYYLSKRDSLFKEIDSGVPADTLGAALKHSSILTKNINARFARDNQAILNADDPDFIKSMADLPNEFVSNTYQPFYKRTGSLERLHERSRLEQLRAGMDRLLFDIKHRGISLDAFIRMRRNDAYNPYTRKAITYNALTSNVPVANMSFGRKGHDVSVITLGLRQGHRPEELDNYPHATSQSQMKLFFVLTHEVAHAVSDYLGIQAFEEDMLREHGTPKDWGQECFADAFAACIYASRTGNWDIIDTVILPYRATEDYAHNTFSALLELKKIDPAIFRKMDNPERDMNRFVDSWIRSTLPNIVAHRDFKHEREISIAARLAVDRPHHNIDPLKNKRPLLLRIQSRIDAVAIEAMATGKADMESTRQLATWVKHLGYGNIAQRMMDSLGGSSLHQLEVLKSMASAHCERVASRHDVNQALIDDYMYELNTSEPDLTADLPSSKEQAPLREQGLSMA